MVPVYTLYHPELTLENPHIGSTDRTDSTLPIIFREYSLYIYIYCTIYYLAQTDTNGSN